MLTGWMPTLLRIGRGLNRYKKRRDAEGPLKLLELYNYENNQFSRLVRPTSIIRFRSARKRRIGEGSAVRVGDPVSMH